MSHIDETSLSFQLLVEIKRELRLIRQQLNEMNHNQSERTEHYNSKRRRRRRRQEIPPRRPTDQHKPQIYR